MNKSDAEKQARRVAYLLVIFVLLVGTVATFKSVHGLKSENQAQIALQYELQSRLLKTEIMRRFLQPVYGMKGARGAYLSQDSFDRDAISAYTASRNMEHEFPGANGFGLVVEVKRSDLETFLQKQQQEFTAIDGIDFSAIGRNLSATDAQNYYLTKYIEPLESNSGLLGLNVGADPQQKQAIAMAVNTKDAVMSRHENLILSLSVTPFTTNDITFKDNPYYYLLPIFKESKPLPKTIQTENSFSRVSVLMGFIYAPLRFGPLLAGATDITNRQLRFTLQDMASSSANTVFDSELHPSIANAPSVSFNNEKGPMLSSEFLIEIGGRQMQLNIASTSFFDGRSDSFTPMMLQAGGLGLSILMSFAIWLLLTGRARAQALAQRMTVDLQRLASVARHTSNAVFITDMEHRITWINDGFTRLYEYSQTEAIGQIADKLLRRTYSSKIFESNKPTAHLIEVTDHTKTGRQICVNLELQPQINDGGITTGYMGISQDITEKKRVTQGLADALVTLTRDKEQLNNILEGTNVGIWQWNIQTSEIEINDRYAEMLGLHLPDLLPFSLKKWRELINTKDQGRYELLMQQHFEKKQNYFECEIRLRHKEGHWVWVMVRGRVSSWKTGTNVPVLMAGTQMDITKRKSSEEALRASKAFLERAEKIAGVGGWEVDLLSNQMMWSDETRKIHDIELHEQPDIAQSLRFFSASDSKKIQQFVEESLQNRRGWDFELPMLTAKKRAVWVRFMGAVELLNDKPVRLVGTMEDVTAARAMRESLQRSNAVMHNIMENLPCGLWVVDAEFNILVQNSQLKKLLELPESLFNTTPTPYEKIIRFCAARGDYGVENTEAAVQKRLSLVSNPVVHQFERNHTGKKPIEVLSVPMPGGGFISTYTDVSERKKMEQLKGEFIATVSHELRTPLTSIYGSLKLLSAGPWSNSLTPEVQKLIAISLRNSERLVRLINDVLDIEKIEAGLMRYNKATHKVDLLLDQAIETTRHYAEQYGVTFHFSQRIADIEVNVDSDRIIQVLVNLLSNASKFADKASLVDISMNCFEQDTSCAEDLGVARNMSVRIEVSNYGAGIPEEFRQRIFGRFSQVDGSDQRQKGGTGLGLNICKSIIQAHGGTIDYSSLPGGKTTFYFDLPVIAGDIADPV